MERVTFLLSCQELVPMKANEVQIGNVCVMKVSGKITRVKLVSITEDFRGRKMYHCLNLATGRECQARSASKFRKLVS